MSRLSVTDLVEILRTLQGGTAPATLRDCVQRCPDVAALTQEAGRRGWLPAYFVQRMAAGNEEELTFGKYLLLDELGEGGMGKVFQAWDTRLHRLVALKVIKAEYLTGSDSLERFRREAQAAARLQHPNIVILHTAARIDGRHCLVMEYVAGSNLQKWVLQNGPLPVETARDYLRQAALALAHIHKQALVHRDVKPGNMLVTADQRTLKLLDMGLARLQDPVEDPHATTPPILSVRGMILGTPEFMAPEQFDDVHAVDGRADIYSLGCSFYFLLTGTVPFKARGLLEQRRKHQQDSPKALQQLRPDVPDDLATIIQKMLAKRPQDRYQSADDIVSALAEEKQPLSPRRRNLMPAIAAMMLFSLLSVAALSAVFWLLWRNHGEPTAGGPVAGVPSEVTPAPPSPSPSPVENPAPQPDPAPPSEHEDRPPFRGNPSPPEKRPPVLLSDVLQVLGDGPGRHWGKVRCLACSPGGDRVATAADNSFYLWNAATLRDPVITEVSTEATVRALAFSPNGDILAVASGSRMNMKEGVEVYRLETGRPVRVHSFDKPERSGFNQTVIQLAFSADGNSLFGVTESHKVWRWDLAHRDRRPEPVSAVPRNAQLMMVLSADARTIAYPVLSLQPGANRTSVAIKGSLDGKPIERQVEKTELGEIIALAVSPKGRFVAIVRGSRHDIPNPRGGCKLTVWDLKEDPPQLRRTYESDKIGLGCLTFSPDETLLTAAGSDRAARVWDLNDKTGEPVVFAGHTAALRGLAFSPQQDALYSCGDDHLLHCWKLQGEDWKKQPRHTAELAGSVVSGVAFTHDGASLALARRSHNVFFEPGERSDWSLWDLKTSKLTRSVSLKGQFKGIALLPSGLLLGWGREQSDSGTHRVNAGFVGTWDIATGKENVRQSFTYEVDEVTQAANAPLLAVMEQLGGVIRLCDAKTLEVRQSLKVDSFSSKGMALAPDGTRLATIGSISKPAVAGAVKTIQFWDTRNLAADPPKKPTASLDIDTFNHGVKLLAYSRDAKRLAAVDDRGVVRLWDAQSQDFLGGCREHPGGPYALAFAPDGRALATVRDNQLTLWDSASLKECHTWSFPGPIESIAFDREGRRLATGNANGTAWILDVTPFLKSGRP